MCLIFKYIVASLFIVLITFVLVLGIFDLVEEIRLASAGRENRREKRLYKNFEKKIANSYEHKYKGEENGK